MMRTADGHRRVELTKFRNPKLVEAEPAIAPPNTLGLRQIMIVVEDIDDTVARLHAYGAELVGEVAQRPKVRSWPDPAAGRYISIDCARAMSAYPTRFG